MNPTQNAKFPLHEAAREGRSKLRIEVVDGDYTDCQDSSSRGISSKRT